MLKQWLEHPLRRGLDIDSPEATDACRQIVQQKRFLRRIYDEWYQALVRAVPQGVGGVLEIGSGPGFLRDVLPGLITSDILPTKGIDLVLNAQQLPFAAGALRAIVMTNVLHHLPGPRQFFTEAGRCVRPGGAMVMVEPWVSAWSRLIYTRLHHEPFDPEARQWEFPATGPLSGANGALPWILFERDRTTFEREFPMWRIDGIRVTMPFRYLVSGGVSMRSLMPGWSFPLWKGIESVLQPWSKQLGMFAFIRLERLPHNS